MSKKVAIWGWWQGNNLGDNWIKATLKKFFPNAEFVPTSVQKLSEYDFVICGGGGLFIYDVIAPFKHIDIGTSYGVLGLGAEFEHSSDTARKLEKHADFFFVRDENSVKCMKVSRKCRSYDITFSIPMPIAPEYDLLKDKSKVFFVWRDGKDLIKNSKFDKYIHYKDVEKEWNYILESYFDEIIYDDFQTKEDDIFNRIKDCNFVVSGRYHGVVAAIQRGIPFIAIDICPKIRALTEECGLSEYCIKVSELNKLSSLIIDAKKNLLKIRKKEMDYVKKANRCLIHQLQYVNEIIYKKLYPYRILHYGSYWMRENDVVNVMADDLMGISDAKKIDLKAYSNNISDRIWKLEKTPNGTICTLDTDKILMDVELYKPDAIILNSGGLCMRADLLNQLKERHITTVGISLSDPDVYPYNGKKYAADFSLFYTNSKWSYETQYDKNKVNIHILPFGASLKHHYYMPEIERKYDLIVVGHARQDRISIVDNLKDVCNIGLYGQGWENGLGIVNGRQQVKAINSGKMYLSFAHTMAGYDNVKVGLFEAMACRQFVITLYMEELEDYFEIGKEIVCYKTIKELKELVKYYLRHDDEREKIMNAGYYKFLTQHTYQQRWGCVLKDIAEIRNGGYI